MVRYNCKAFAPHWMLHVCFFFVNVSLLFSCIQLFRSIVAMLAHGDGDDGNDNNLTISSLVWCMATGNSRSSSSSNNSSCTPLLKCLIWKHMFRCQFYYLSSHFHAFRYSEVVLLSISPSFSSLPTEYVLKLAANCRQISRPSPINAKNLFRKKNAFSNRW